MRSGPAVRRRAGRHPSGPPARRACHIRRPPPISPAGARRRFAGPWLGAKGSGMGRSVGAQGDDGVDVHGALAGDEAGDQGDET